jgi:hypothetical protein
MRLSIESCEGRERGMFYRAKGGVDKNLDRPGFGKQADPPPEKQMSTK